MLAKRALGHGAASKKYDVLTALGVHACGGTKFQQRLVLRFMTAVTARYNWQRDELTMGRAELARLWQVNERTVKRELAKLKLAGWLLIKRPSARGRVTAYAVDWDKVLLDTRASWAFVGPDFELRLSSADININAVDPPDRKVVAFPTLAAGDTEWHLAQEILRQTDPAFHANWLSHVTRAGISQGVLELVTASSFQAEYLNTHASSRLTQAVREIAPHIQRVVVRPA